MQHALFAAIVAAALFAGSASAAPQATQPPAPGNAPASSAPKLSPADQKRLGAIQQYQHDLVSVVALRADPDYLLGAAILSEPFQDPTKGLDFGALIQRAASAPNGYPAADWVRLGACADKDHCPNPEAFAKLKKEAAGNAAVWLIELDLAAQKKDTKAELAALRRAADAQVYDDYYGKALGGVAKATEVLPPLPDTITGAHDGEPDNPDGVRVLVAVNATQDYLRPSFQPLIELCGKDAVAKAQERRAECLKLAHTLQWGSSPIGQAAGLHIHSELDPADADQDAQASQNLQWQVQEYSQLLERSLTNQPQAAKWLATAGNGGTELSLILATLRDNGVPTEAPAAAPAASAGG